MSNVLLDWRGKRIFTLIKKLSQRYDQLCSQIVDIEGTLRSGENGNKFVDEEMLSEWKIKIKSLVVKTCGADSEHVKGINDAERKHVFDTNYRLFKRLRPVFMAAKDDFQGGFLVSIRNLVQAEVFDSELDQAKELLSSGYKGPSAVVAGVVLETALKDLCDQNSIEHAKLDKMNSDLVRLGIYNKLQQKKITALADIRNSAAHGDWESFSANEAQEMIRDVENFLSIHLA